MDKVKVFKRLRKAAFLNPEDKNLWKQIACIYTASGLGREGEGYMNIHQALSEKEAINMVKKTPAFNKSQCEKNADCVLFPLSCGKNVPKKTDKLQFTMFSLNQDQAEYERFKCLAQGINPLRICNNKCQCGSTEQVTNSQEQTILYQTVCRKQAGSKYGRCSLVVDQSQTQTPASKEVTQPSSGSGTSSKSAQ